jgi:hypothetical protein
MAKFRPYLVELRTAPALAPPCKWGVIFFSFLKMIKSRWNHCFFRLTSFGSYTDCSNKSEPFRAMINRIGIGTTIVPVFFLPDGCERGHKNSLVGTWGSGTHKNTGRVQVSNFTNGYPTDTHNLRMHMNICKLCHMHIMSSGSFNM